MRAGGPRTTRVPRVGVLGGSRARGRPPLGARASPPACGPEARVPHASHASTCSGVAAPGSAAPGCAGVPARMRAGGPRTTRVPRVGVLGGSRARGRPPLGARASPPACGPEARVPHASHASRCSGAAAPGVGRPWVRGASTPACGPEARVPHASRPSRCSGVAAHGPWVRGRPCPHAGRRPAYHTRPTRRGARGQPRRGQPRLGARASPPACGPEARVPHASHASGCSGAAAPGVGRPWVRGRPRPHAGRRPAYHTRRTRRGARGQPRPGSAAPGCAGVPARMRAGGPRT